MSSTASPSASALTLTCLIDEILMTKADKPGFDLSRLRTQIDAFLALYHTRLIHKSAVGEKFDDVHPALTLEDRASTIVELISKEIKDYSEYNETIIRVLNAFQNVHWVAVTLLVTCAALQITDTIAINEECFTLLKFMRNLSNIVLQFQDIPIVKIDLRAKLNKSIQLIVEGAILGYNRRDDKQELQQLMKSINDMCNTLLLEASTKIVGSLPMTVFNQDASKTSAVENSSSYTDQQSQIELANSSTYRRQEQQIQRDPETSSFSRVRPAELPLYSSITIRRVREDIRRFQPKSYDPERVGFGFHHELNPYSTEIGEKKVLALCTTIKRLKGMTIDNLLGEIQNSIIRHGHIDITASFPQERWVRNIVLDACFILEFLRASYRFLDPDVEKEIMIDIFKLENQIPLFVLSKILELEFQTPEQAITELARILCMQPQFAILPFYLKPMELEILQAEIEENIKEHPRHLLHLFSKVVEAFLKPSNIPMNDMDADVVNNCINFMSSLVWRNVSILQKFVIRFKASKNGEVQFKKRWFGSVVYLPQIFIFKDTRSLLWNLIAFEDEYGESKIISKFIRFLNGIIQSNDENIALLRQGQIIVSEYDDEELASMFHDLANAICGSRSPFENVPNCGPFENVLRHISEEYWKLYSFNKPKHVPWSISFSRHVLWISWLLVVFALLISFNKYGLSVISVSIILPLLVFALLISFHMHRLRMALRMHTAHTAILNISKF